VDSVAAAALAATPAASQDTAALGTRETAGRPAAPGTTAPVPSQPAASSRRKDWPGIERHDPIRSTVQP
jgi:hypothetical protein